MIDRVLLRDFKTHSSLDLKELAPISIIMGPNNIGKSAVLHALAVPTYGLANSPEMPIGARSNIPRSGSNTAVVQIWYGNQSIPLEYIVSKSDIDPNPPFTRNGQTYPTWVSNVLRGNAVYGYPGLYFRQTPSPLSPRLGGFESLDSARYISALRGLPETFAHNPMNLDVGPRGENTGNILHNLISSRDKRFQGIEGWAKELGLRISTISSQTVDVGRGVTWYEVGPSRTESTYVGSGTLAVVPILVQGALCQEGQTLLVEEPESHLHRGAMNGLWKFFQDCAGRGVQVVMTSHSFDFLKALYRRVRSGEVSNDLVRVFSLRSETEGVTLSETFQADSIADQEDRIVRSLSTP